MKAVLPERKNVKLTTLSPQPPEVAEVLNA